MLFGKNTNAQSPNDFSLSFGDTTRFDILHEDRPLLIITPHTGNLAEYSLKEIYSELYILDGETKFSSTVVIVEGLK